MSDVSFVIEYPIRLDNKKSPFRRNFDYQKTFYNNLFEVLEEDNISYRKILLSKYTDPLKGFGKDEFYLGYHRKGISKPRMYTIKEAYTLHEMYLDKTGYSGWAEMANNEELFKESQRVELDEAKRFLSGYVKKYEENGSTKYKQSSEISKTPLKFVLVLMQVSNDTVSKLADISSYNLAKMVSDGYSGSDFSVVIKPHPRDVRFKPNMVNNKDAIIVNDSIYSLIPKSSAVYTVNSGAGFESLLYRKPVFTSGHNDYHWVTTRVRNRDDIEKTKSQFDIDKDSIVKFLYYFLNEYVITYDNKEQIRRKIMKIMNGANNADRRV